MKRYDMVESEDGDFVLYKDYLVQQGRAVAAEKKLEKIRGLLVEVSGYGLCQDSTYDALLDIAKLFEIDLLEIEKGVST